MSSMSKNIWDIGAKEYADSAKTIDFYAETNRRIVSLVKSNNAKDVLDLGCGGNSEILSSLFEQGYEGSQLVGGDNSLEMIANAKENFKSKPGIEFHHVSAESVDGLGKTFDAITMNSAFCLTDMKATLDSVLKSLNTEGCFIFSIPQWHIKGSKADYHPKYDAINKELAERGFALKEQKGASNRYSYSEIFAMLEDHSFQPYLCETIEIDINAEQWSAYYSIPSFAAMSLPHLPVEDALEVLSSAMTNLKSQELPSITWAIFVAKKV